MKLHLSSLYGAPRFNHEEAPGGDSARSLQHVSHGVQAAPGNSQAVLGHRFEFELPELLQKNPEDQQGWVTTRDSER